MNIQIQLSNYELWFLLSLTAPNIVIGFRNPMTGLLAEDIFPLVQEASFSLLDRDLIYADANHSIKMRGELEQLMNTLTKPQHTILAAYQLNSQQKEVIRSYNFQENYTVLLENLTDNSLLLREIESKDDLLSLIAEPFLDKIFWAPDSEPLDFPEEDITAIQQWAGTSGFNKVRNKLEAVKGDEQSKAHLLETLQHPLVKYSFIGFLDRNDLKRNIVDGFAVLAGEHYLWILEIVDEADKLVRVSKITMKELNTKFDSILPFSSGA